jgi:hypothetical protein
VRTTNQAVGRIDDTATDPVDRLRALCLALPEVTERASHGEPSFFVRDKKQFVMLDSYHHDAPHLGFWCAAPPGARRFTRLGVSRGSRTLDGRGRPG